MKIKHILSIWIIGLILVGLGMLFKLMHWPGAHYNLLFGTLFKSIAGVLAVYKLFTLERFKEFLNS